MGYHFEGGLFAFPGDQLAQSRRPSGHQGGTKAGTPETGHHCSRKNSSSIYKMGTRQTPT